MTNISQDQESEEVSRKKIDTIFKKEVEISFRKPQSLRKESRHINPLKESKQKLLQRITKVVDDSDFMDESPNSVRGTELSDSSGGISTATGSKQFRSFKKILTRN